MTNELSPLDPERFGLSSFADLLSPKGPLFGEDWDAFETLHDALYVSLAPITAYEATMAESLIAIEWELVERRKMRRDSLQEHIKQMIVAAYLKSAKESFAGEEREALEKHVEEGGSAQNWSYGYYLNEDYVKDEGRDLAERALSKNPKERKEALKEIEELDIDFELALGTAYANQHGSAFAHEEAVKDLEKRRREVMRDYEALQRMRPIAVEVVSE